MFKGLKDKLSGWLKKTSKQAEEIVDESEEVVTKVSKRAPKKSQVKDEKKTAVKKEEKSQGKKKTTSKKASKATKADVEKIAIPTKNPPKSEVVEEKKEKVEEESLVTPKKTSFFGGLKSAFTGVPISEDYFSKVFEDLEIILLESGVAFSAVDQVRKVLSEELVGKTLGRKEVESRFRSALRKAVGDLLVEPDFDIIQKIKNKEGVSIVVFCGINGSGKTTSLAKFGSLLKSRGVSCVFAASDTFRAASIEQLSVHGENLDTRVIKQGYGSDPASVAFDAIAYAKSHGIKCVLVDTAGRMHTKQYLIDELGKIMRVANPDFKIFVGESITGNDATEQASVFDEAISVDGVILTKADIDQKGGTAVSVSSVIHKPILFLGVGQEYGDLKPFKKSELLSALGL